MGKSHNHSHSDSPEKNIATAFFLNLGFAVIELIGGFITNSVAILSDAVHDFGDALSLGVAYYLQKVSQKKGDNRYSYGYKRFSLLGSIFISLVLILGSAFIINEGVARIIEPQQADSKGMMILAVLGIVVNGIAVLKLKKGKTHNEKAVLLHLTEDVLGWVAVLIGSIIMTFVDIPILDPIMSIGITLWVLFNVYKNLKETVRIMLQEIPGQLDLIRMKEEILELPSVISMHDIHLWTMDGDHHILTLHIVVDKSEIPNECRDLKKRVREVACKYGAKHITIEIESEEESLDCTYRTDPC
ncbi:MAG: cation diffusion facilitator family transporter [Bacteroidales bacterium]|jgi:cobalt-zinc-cadmium efflux system protein|nr:cation diffusion facilitator family transporter [Bacteroidales bacterium]